MQSVSINTYVVRSIPVRGEVYSIHYMWLSLLQVGGNLVSRTNKTDAIIPQQNTEHLQQVEDYGSWYDSNNVDCDVNSLL
jgi:hypothetical protein